MTIKDEPSIIEKVDKTGNHFFSKSFNVRNLHRQEDERAEFDINLLKHLPTLIRRSSDLQLKVFVRSLREEFLLPS